MTTPMPYRVLVTGSRDWDAPTVVGSALAEAISPIAHATPQRYVVVVHGSCPTGADRHADDWASWMRQRGRPIDVERHPANWRPNGELDRAAGFRRNAEMVEAGADLCLAFIRNNSRGASHTADLAERAGIETRRFTA